MRRSGGAFGSEARWLVVVCGRLRALTSRLLVSHRCREDGEEAGHQDTDSDVAEQRDGGKLKVKWTQEEVSARTWVLPTVSHVVSGSDGSPGQQTSATAASPLFVCVCL